MQALEKTLRNKLERTVMEARDVAEAAARAAVEQLGVGEPKPYAHLSADEKELRRKLRIHGRQLGDFRHAKKETQEIARLVEEIAYEHWHRMLFARFLAENNLLMYPDPDEPVAVSLEECEDLAAEEGAKNGWELASRFAARMLPQIFRPDSPVFQLELPPEHQQKLERLLAELPVEVFHASDSLGWVYQFWQAKKKDEVNRSEVKIGARELPAVTQLFTEPYMVAFLLDNSLGAWWAARRLTEDDLKNAKTEDELRQKASLPGVPLEYLRFVKGEDGKWTPAAGTFDGWPEKLAELKTLDPCCGSGHFLVAAFLMLVPMRMELEGLTAREAVDRVLAENIHGLEIDQRCVELAAFALALAAWRYLGAGGYRQLPELNVACSGLSISAKKEEWLALADGDNLLSFHLEQLYKLFKDAPVLGSLINPEASLGKGSLFELNWEEVGPLLSKALGVEKDDEKGELGIVAKGLAKTAEIVQYEYDLLFTNPPYLGERKQSQILRSFSQRNYYDSRADLAVTFLSRGEVFVRNGCQCLVLPQNWLYQKSYNKLRVALVEKERIAVVSQLGANAFESSIGADVLLLILANNRIAVSGIDATFEVNPPSKAKLLSSGNIIRLETSKVLGYGDARIVLEKRCTNIGLLKSHAEGLAGIQNGDVPKFQRSFWEVSVFCQKWHCQQATFPATCHYGGLHLIIDYDMEKGHLRESRKIRRIKLHDSDQRGNKAWGKKGITVSLLGELRTCQYRGWLLDQSAAVVLPVNEIDYLPIFCFTQDSSFNAEVRKIDKKRNVTNATLVEIPFDLDHWTKVAQEKYPNGLPMPYSDDPTQWIFHGHPCGSVIWDEETKWTVHGPLRTDATVLQAAVARLLGYRWPAELDSEMELSDEARAFVGKCNDLLKFADKDGIVCIPPVRGEASATDRLLNLLAAAYGDDWSTDKLSELLKQADHTGKTLDSWLRDKFFAQHCQLFHQRPFIWHIWDGLRGGFSVLVNYHKLDRKNLETLIYTYLGDWIKRQKDDISSGVDGAQERLAAAETLKKRLELILEGETPYDIFVRWKPIEKQPIGWDPDLNDGVRLNIRPFMSVPDVKKKGAGILREKPKIHWKKDRGKDVKSAPWYHLFKGDRINDHHLSLDEKRAARGAVK
ncbi:MAG: N-6 DNA methylase [Planctomycetes bacterium]|nr:N-6 DNA methylase [Planctomycetota bacterium]